MDHDDVRTLISADEPLGDEAEAHLRRCRTCARWRSDLARVRAVAPASFEMPSGLPDRIMTKVRAVPEAAVLPIEPHRARRIALKAAIAAALAAGIAVGSVMLPRGAQPALAATIEKTEKAGTARFESLTTFSIDAPPGVRTGPITGRINGRGEIVFPDRLHMFGSFTSSIAPAAFAVPSGSFEAVVIGGKTLVRTGVAGERWIPVRSAPGAIVVDFDPADALSQLRRFGGPVSDLGTQQFYGKNVRHYGVRFDGGTTGLVRADVYVGSADGLLHGFNAVHRVAAAGATVQVSSGYRLFEFGVAVTVAPPSDETVGVGVQVGPLFFGGVSVTIDVDASQPDRSQWWSGLPAWRPPAMSFPIPRFSMPSWTPPTFPGFPGS